MTLRDLSFRDVAGALEELCRAEAKAVMASSPRLEPFADDFEALRLRARAQHKSGQADDYRVGLRAERDAKLATFDRLTRQLFHLVQAARLAADEAQAKAATRAHERMFSKGLSDLRRGVRARHEAAFRAHKRLRAADRAWLGRLSAPDGTALELHETRLEIIDSILDVAVRARGDKLPAPDTAVAVRRDFFRVYGLLGVVLEVTGAGKKEARLLTEPVEAPSRRADRNRRRRERRRARASATE